MMSPMTSEIRRTTSHLIKVLGKLHDMTEANIERAKHIQHRIDYLRTRLESGMALSEIVEGETQPLIPTLITENIEALQAEGQALRQAEAAALRAHGYTMERIAGLFGVTRQRISALLKDA